MTINNPKELRALPEGTSLCIYERFEQDCREPLVLKKHIHQAFIAAPPGNLEAEKLFVYGKTAFKPDKKGFALVSELGRIAARFEVVSVPKPKEGANNAVS